MLERIPPEGHHRESFLGIDVLGIDPLIVGDTIMREELPAIFFFPG